jgi:hypothetical protein
MRSCLWCAVLVPLVASSSLRAQSAPADTTPFHAGQWAAQFVAGTQFVSAGVLHFRSPRSAWLLDGSFNVGRNTFTTAGSTNTQTQWSGTGTLRFGLRSYRAGGPSTNFFGTYGILVSGGGSSLSDTAFTSRVAQWGAGVFGELGANYMITPRFSVGAAAGLQARYTWARSTILRTVSSSVTEQAFTITGALLSLGVGVYF